MDRIIETEREVMKAIAASSCDSPVLMINQNRYLGKIFLMVSSINVGEVSISA